MDIKEKIEEVVEKIKKDPDLASSFASNPVKTIEKILGVDLPDDMVENVVNSVKAKLAGGEAGGILDKFKKLF